MEVRMTNLEKAKKIIPWINPEERVTVHFIDEQNLNEIGRASCRERV